MKTILFGNGLNYFSKNFVTWKQLLDTIKGANLFANGSLPNTMIYERSIIGNPISFDTLTKKEEAIKKEIATMLNGFPSNSYFEDLSDIRAENYLTTNYDNGFLENYLKNPDVEVVNRSTEDIYSLRRCKEIMENGKLRAKIWHIHGEIETPPSIMLGLDHYCGSVAKISSYVKGTYDFEKMKNKVKVPSILDKLKGNNDFDETSWIELFFRTDIHIVGLGLDFSEIDLWWILNKRARFILDNRTSNLITNKIFYYATTDEEDQRELLKALNVIYVSVELDHSNEQYNNAYDIIITKIRSA